MNIATYIASAADAARVAQEAAQQMKDKVIVRLDISAEIIRNVYRKRRLWSDTMPSALAWAWEYSRPDAQVTFTSNTAHPIVITRGDQTYSVSAVLVYGSTWDIAKETRRVMYEHRMRRWEMEHAAKSHQVSQAQNDLARESARVHAEVEKEIARLHADAARKIVDYEKTLGINVQCAGKSVAMLKSQMANLQQRYYAKH